MGSAEMLRFKSKFSFICCVLFSFQHAELENCLQILAGMAGALVLAVSLWRYSRSSLKS